MRNSLTRLNVFFLMILLFLCTAFIPAPCRAGNVENQAGASDIPEKQLESILADVEKNFSKITTMKTKLVQNKNISLFSEPILSRGILLYQFPDKIRLEFFDPFQSVLLVSGNKISRYEVFNGKWKKMDAGSEKMMQVILDHITAWIKGQFNQDNMYRVSGRYRPQGSETGYSIVLEPRAEEFKKYIQAFELGVNSKKDRLEFIIIRESGEDFTRIDFSSDLINTPIETDFFKGNSHPLSPAPVW